MPPENSKRTALIAEGLTEAEADFMISGGTKTDGLNLSSDGTPSEKVIVEPVRDIDDKAPPADAKGQQQPHADDDADSPPPPKDSPFYSRWQRDRQRRQELQTALKERDDKLAATSVEMAAEREKWARLDERLRVFREASEAPDPAALAAAQPKTKPDREADPFGYMAWLEERLEKVSSDVEQTTTRTQERDAAVELTSTFRNDAAQYSRNNPDFWETAPNAHDGAYHYLMRNRDAQLQALGYADPQERMRIIAADERDIVARAFEARQRNPSAPGPSEVLFNLAMSLGYQKRAPAAAPPLQNGATPPAANGAANGQARPGAATAPPPAATTVTDQIRSIQQGQAASRSLSSAGGAPPPTGIDLAAIAEMSDNEYAGWVRGLTAAQKREYQKLIGA